MAAYSIIPGLYIYKGREANEYASSCNTSLCGFLLPIQMAPSGHMDPSHNPGQQGLHNPNLSAPPGSQLHHRNPPLQARQPLGPSSGAGPSGELAFNSAASMMGQPGMTGTGEGPEPALDVSMVHLLLTILSEKQETQGH